MTIDLISRINSAESILNEVNDVLVRESSKLQPDVLRIFQDIATYKNQCRHWKEIIEVRQATIQFLEDLESKVNRENRIMLGSVGIPFRQARAIGVQSYLTSFWSLSDTICALPGLIFCPTEKNLNPRSPPQLVSHFVGVDTKKSLSHAFRLSVPTSYGWPIALLYAIRNIFIHDGGIVDGYDFFEGFDPSTGFQISSKGWEAVLERANSYGVNSACQKNGVTWLPLPRNDLRIVFQECQKEIDEALGVLLTFACHSIRSHLGILLGEA